MCQPRRDIKDFHRNAISIAQMSNKRSKMIICTTFLVRIIHRVRRKQRQRVEIERIEVKTDKYYIDAKFNCDSRCQLISFQDLV